MERGHVKLWRKSIDSGLIQSPNLWTFWSWCLLKATWKNRSVVMNMQTINLLPGQLVFGRKAASKELNMSEQTIRTCLEKLKKLKNITIKSTSHYSIISIVNWDIYQSNQPTDNHLSNQPLTSHQPAANHKQKVKDIKEGKEINILSDSTESDQSGQGDYPDVFEKFWEAYPKKEGKGAAYKSYQKIKAPRPTLKIILDSIETHSKTEKWKNKQYIPLPATFLNQRRWEDEFTPEDFNGVKTVNGYQDQQPAVIYQELGGPPPGWEA